MDPGAEPPRIKLCWVPPPPPPGSSIRLLEREKQIGDQKQARLSLSIPFRFRSIWLTADKDYSPLKEPLSFCFDKIIILQVDRLPKNTAVDPLVTFLLDRSTWSTLLFLDTRTRLGAGCHHASPLTRKVWRYPPKGELRQNLLPVLQPPLKRVKLTLKLTTSYLKIKAVHAPLSSFARARSYQ